MAKLYFKYGAMGSSKTAQALITAYNYIEKGQKPLLVKPDVENRDGQLVIHSRIGIERECILWSEFRTMSPEDLKAAGISVVIVDECQFLEEEDIDYLSDLVDFYDIAVLCFGLRTDFRTESFPGSKRLLEVADSIEEIKTICKCGKKATMNARIDDNGMMITDGAQIDIGGNERYISLCRRCHKQLKAESEDRR